MNTRNTPDLLLGPRGRWRPTLKLIRSPREAFEEWSKQYGDPFYVHALNGPVVVTGRPDLIREIFAHDSAEYDIFAQQSVKPILGEGSMLLLTGQRHRQERKLIMPMFHGDRMRAYAQIMQTIAIDGMERISQGKPFEMLSTTTRISLDVIVQTIFGGENQQSIAKLMQLSGQTMKSMSPLLFFSRKTHFHFFGLSPWDRFTKSQSELRAAFESEIQRRQDAPMERQDILTLLTKAHYEDGSAITAEHTYDELGTFLFAGHETTAVSLAWAMYHLHSNPQTLQTLQDELKAVGDDSPESLAKLPYLKAVVQETMRLNPIVTEVIRLLKSPMQLAEYKLPAGTAVAPASVLAHYREETFPEPNAFRPERFIDRTYSPAEYFPFGGGNRRCAGAAFASYEMAIVLGTILSKWKLQLLETSPVTPKRRNITMGPSTGIRMQTVGRL